MAFSYACLVLQRVVLPAVLVLASLMRPVGISFVYMLMFFMSPFVPLATRRNFKGSVTAFFIILLALSTLVLLGHIALQVLALSTALPIYNCSFSERLLRHIGFVSFVDLRPLAIIEWLAPEVLVLATSLGAFLSVKRLALQNINAEQLENGELPDSQSEQQVSSQQDANGSDVQQATATTPLQHQQQQLRKRVSMISQHIHFEGLIKISPLFCLATLFFAAVLRPSVPGGFYFLIFLLAGTYWATCQTLQRGFALLLRCVMFVLVLHSLCIVSYQTPWMQSHLNHTSLAARLIGLEPLIESDCVPDIRILLYNNRLSLDSYLNPFALFFAYFALALTTKHLIKPRLEPKPATAFGQTLECNNSSNINNASSNSNIINNSNSNNTGNRFNRQLSLLTSQTTRSGGIGGVSVSGSGGHRKDSSGVGVGVGVNATVAVGVGGATTSRTQRLSVSLRREQRATLNEPTETTPLVRQSTRKARTPQALESTTAAATTAPSGSRGNDIQLDTIERRSEQENNTTSILDQISYGFVSVGGFIYQNSYIFTNILMMAWSIVYHSWLTFVLLLWANVLWMIPNQRKAMMRSSPFIVLYAELLLVAQYIYGMDLNNNELPTRVSTAGINLQQIGFERPIENHMRPCVPLIVKTAFVLMFWVTSRQFFKEKRDRRRDSTLADIIAPLQITVGSAGSSYLINDGKKTSKFLKKAGDVIKNLLVRLWIWLLVLVIFLCAITGDDMTGFRICYMALFLFFLLVFQSSSKAWVKIMYGFWLFLIFYAMSILILIYTYQFDKFDMYWKDYLNVSQTLQADIGLKLYKTKDLFLHLVSPTIIVILTVIQVHYFHKRFIASLQQQPTTPGTRSQLTAANAQQKRTETAALEAAPSKRRGSASSIRQRSTEAAGTAAGATTTDFETSVRDLVRISFRKIKNKSEYIFKRFKTVFWRFLELHIMKAVYIAAFVCSVSEVCVLHIIFVGFCVLGATSRKAVQVVISRLISFIVTIIVLSKMIYQIEYLDHNQYSVTCSDNRTANNAEWIGLNKADKLEGGLMGLLRTYIIYMVIVTMHAVISLRQLQMRVKIGENVANQPKLLFQQITRADAEKDLVGLVKYLLNFGFYKFGIEISLIALVSTITYRQDIVAVVYAVWLVVLLLLKRSQCAKMWGVFQAFFAISILLQYIVLVGLPPSWCMSYPWDDGAFGESIQRWTMLPGQLHFNHVPKLIFDFIVLIILNRQKSIFCIEQRYATNDDYPGGSNRSVIADIAQLGRVPFDNPTHDFCSYIRNYSDILKNGVLCGFYWFTLAVVFLAGTNIADLLALGYLIGAFVFLWQGSDFYLRPIATIISRWKWLLAFNVANILIKTSFQMAGCLFMTPLTTHCCWLVHMLGITCTSNVIKEQLHVADEAEVLTDSTGCPKMTHQVVLLWDAICFAFIIFQLRIFQSHYFCHIITDTKANNILASRGADIIESLRQKQIAHRHDHEKQVLHKIKRKMERIRATQQKMLRPLDKQTHFDELPAPTVRRRKDIKLHPHATRAGDYYMFEEMDDKFELDLIHDEIDFMEEENITESEMKMQRRKTLYDKSKDAPTDFFPSTSKGVSKERDAAASSMSSPKPTKDLTDLPSTPALTTVPREATSKETSDSKSKMELDSGDVTAKDSDEDFDTNPIIRLLEGFLVTLTIRLNRFSRNYRFVNRILAGEKKTLKESSSLNRLGLSSAAAMFHFLKSNLESDENGGQPVTSSTPRRTQVTATIPSATTSATTTSDNLTEHYSTPPNTNTNTNTNTTTTPLSPQEPLATPPQPPPATSTPHQSHHAGEDIIEIPVDTVDAATSRKQSISSSPPTKGRKSDCGLPEIRIKAPSMERSGQQQQQTPHHFTPHSYPQQHSHHQQQASIGSGSLSKHWSYEHVDSAGEFNLEEENFAQRDHHIIVEVLISSWYALLANTDLICYIVVFINQVVNASLISLPLPIMVFLWGTLSLPRPTKTFWVTLIAYTQAIVLIKCIFQFKLIWSNYNNLPNQPLAPAKIFGVEMKTHYAVYDLILLLVLFLHRYLLKSQGLWKSGYKDVDQQFTKPTASIDEREDSDNLSQPDSRQLNEDAAQKMSLQVSQVSLPGSPEYSKSAINQLERTKYTSSLHKFFFSLVHKSRLATDVYALMFLCDFINFFVLLFGFTAFGTQQTESDGGVQTYLAENKVPVPFLIMLLVQFLLIVIDRALYLRKALVNKIIFHFFSVIGIHIWMFFVVPAVTERTFNSLAPPIIFYVIKCFYMLLSSYQIKSGYPKRILGNFFTKGFSMVNMIAFKVYMQIPFLYELRTILDWVCIDSTMTIFDWLKMEDIFSNIYLIRCTRQSETDFPAMRAQKKASLSKLIMGGTVVLLIVICIWGPLCLFALGNAVGSSNVPYQVSLSIRIGPYDPIYTTNNYDSIFEIDSKMYTQMTNAFFKNKQALTFIAGYDATDVAAVKLAGNSPSLWNIAPPDKQRLTNDLRNNHTLIARFSYSLTRKAPAKGLKENVGDEHVIKLDETFEGRAALINMLNETLDPIETNENGTTNGNNTTPASSSADDVVVVLPNMIPKFIKVLNSGDAFVATVMSGKEQEYRPLVIKLHRDKATKAMWWEIRDYCYDSFYNNTLKDLAYSDCKSGIVMYTFNDKKFPSTFSFLTAGGIIGLYTTFVLLASRFMKSFIGGQNRKIMFEDLPYVDRVLQLCLDIYLVREALEFALEEDLFAKLLFLYRSPETLIKWTRPKEEYLDDDGDTDSIPSRMSVRRPEQLQQHQYQQQQQQQQQ
ncbi:piezo-type mechanosensitive ion channel component isoform X1 [Drosophila sulfurigaster albostrigata]|uniref:piezo-type mechanosensitive ion channel component isoform X1 n=1 Tax=Drosophila sulfurigaster albostrigata TaxID=89887 RepID=UPI002D21B8BA|nr:piezo-type mechanosensitive ion channel component isoform X1 [Drosophila sulfurigaster albostrigata]